MTRTRWHLWLGSEVKGRCAICGTRWFVFRYTNGELDIWACLRHRHVVPGMPLRRRKDDGD